jgi:hypothetical protein
MGFAVLDLLPARAILWEPSAPLEVAHYHMICFWPHIRRKIKLSNKVPIIRPSFLPVRLTSATEAAIDANAPLEDEEAANGPVDSDEELTSVMHGLSNWNPQPVVPPLIQLPIDREYQKKRLYEQLHNATNGFTVNICKVVGYGAQKLHPSHHAYNEGEGDADGEADLSALSSLSQGMHGVSSRRASGFTVH